MDPNRVNENLAQHVKTCVNMLLTPTPTDSEQQLQFMVDHCRKWDQVYGYNAREMYPELIEIWNQYGY